jgi:hypothetical protein
MTEVIRLLVNCCIFILVFVIILMTVNVPGGFGGGMKTRGEVLRGAVAD